MITKKAKNTKKPFEDIFIKNYPTIDLHGYDRETARVNVNLFIEENNTLNNKDLVIIHGVGMGIIKKQVHDTLKKNKYVLTYKVHTFNIGCTIVKLK
ncbi:MAG: Smr/MutS family protein [Bacilli bacterium]|nr:Smr/MutS family protein [Bacilli bacterium]